MLAFIRVLAGIQGGEPLMAGCRAARDDLRDNGAESGLNLRSCATNAHRWPR